MLEYLEQGEEALGEYLKTTKIRKVVKLPGDASTRKYYRVFTEQKSFILMKTEPFPNEGLSLPFVVLQKHMQQSGIDVPQVYDIEPSQGFMLLEDLGDVTLLRKLQEVNHPQIEREIYERIIDSLIDMQLQCSPPAHSGLNLDAFKMRFDHEKLMWEMEFMIEHFYKGYLARDLDPNDLKLMRDSLSEICTALANEPTVFTHRDFHSRNVMVVPTPGVNTERYVMIDFQDARLGPPQYDLASLLKDSYYQLEEAQIEGLLDYYRVRYESLTGVRLDRTHFIRMFDLMSVQRNLKAIGSFASFIMKRNNPGYLKYIGNTFENVRRTLLKYPEYSQLREVLFHYYYF
jgi:N-acetylmuramate 1-kinase